MSNVKELVKANIDTIKKLLFSEEEKKQEYAETTLVDGTVVKANPALENGAEVIVVTSEGEIPAPDGEHQLADGTIIVTVEGKISEIKEVEEVEDEDMKNEFAKIAEGINSKIAEATQAFTAEVAKLTAELNTAKEQFESAKKETESKDAQNETFKKEVFTLLQKIADMPASDPNVKSHSFTKVDKDETPKNEVEVFINSYLTKVNK